MEENIINLFSYLISCGLYTATTQLQQVSAMMISLCCYQISPKKKQQKKGIKGSRI